MKGSKLIRLAEEFCEIHHEGQFRKCGNIPYSTHCKSVRDRLVHHGYDDVVTQCQALLHDVVEDTEAFIDEISKKFGFEVSNGVYVLSKNTIKRGMIRSINRALSSRGIELTWQEIFRIRLATARISVRRVKIADIVDNTVDLENLSKKGRAKKINEANSFYLPMADDIAPEMAKEIRQNIANYRARVRKNKK